MCIRDRYNRSYCGVYLRRDGALGEERGFLYMDMDNFKLYNDLYGDCLLYTSRCV